MKKLALNLDELEVTSFEVSSSTSNERGTVNGQAIVTWEPLRDYALSWLIACAN